MPKSKATFTISGKLALMLAGLFLIILIQLAMLAAAMQISVGVRAYVSGENLWSKAQKNAVFHLVNFVHTGDQDELDRFHRSVGVTLHIREARLEMESQEFRRDKVEASFLQAGVHPDDIPGLIMLFRRFGDIRRMAEAIDIWRAGDAGIDELAILAERIQAARSDGGFGKMRGMYVQQVYDLHERLNALELEFSSTLGAAARWTSRSVIVTGLLVTCMLLVAGFVLWLWLTNGIRRGVKELCDATEHMVKGDLDYRIVNIAGDELGSLALTFNDMLANRSRVENTLDNERRFLEVVLDNLAEAVIACDAQGKLSLFNRSAKMLHGLDTEQPPPDCWAGHHGELFHADARTPLTDEEDPLLSALIGESVKDREVVIAPYHREPRSVLANAEALTDGDGRVLGAVVTLHDITERLRAEKAMEKHAEELEQANHDLQHRNLELRRLYHAEAASEAKSRFVATMSHEIRTPLHCIIGLIELFNEGTLSAEQRHNLRLISESSQALMQLVNDVLDFAKIESGQLELEERDFGLSALVQPLVATLKREADRNEVEVNVALDSGLPPTVRGDAARLRQVLLNLLNNALKFTPGGEKVALEISPVSDAKIRFSVSDTGIGMDADTCSRVFESFVQADVSTTRRYGGSGLGLSICKSLVEQMGGYINCESTPGAGTRFFFDLPLAAAQDAATAPGPETFDAEESATDPFPAGEPARVLIAEDNQVNRLLIEQQMRRYNCNCTIVEDGQQALAELRRSSFDLLITDLQMPQLDGFDLTSQWRAIESRRPTHRPLTIIALSANADKQTLARCQECGVDETLFKPLTLKRLDQMLRRTLARPQVAA